MQEFLILGLTWQAWFTIALFIVMFTLLTKSKLPTEVVFMGVLAMLVITGCLNPKDALSGFSSQSVVVVGILFIVVAGMEQSGVLQWIVSHVMGIPKTFAGAITRLMLPVAFLSSFMNNATVVALFVGIVKLWGKKMNLAPSKMLIPLTYAAGLGGMCTLIGSPTNLIIAELYKDMTGNQVAMFDPLGPGVCCVLVGLGTIILLQRLLPIRKSPEEKLQINQNEQTTGLYVKNKSHLIGYTIGELSLSVGLTQSHLLGVVHYDGEVEAVTKENADTIFLMGGDTLIFTGNRDEVIAHGDRYGLGHSMAYSAPDPKEGKRTLLSSLIMLGMVILSSLNIMSLLASAMLAALLMVVCRCCKADKIISYINWRVLIIYAISVALGLAIERNGIASLLSNCIIDCCQTNAVLAFVMVCVITTATTEFISNTACAAIFTPIAVKLASEMGANPMTFIVGIIICCTANFATPIGSARHLLVYVPGGYKFTDFTRIGIPMDIIIVATCVVSCLLFFPING